MKIKEIRNMTTLLKQMIEKASRLSEEEQNAFAKIMLKELEDDERWRRSFARSKNALKELALEALQEHKKSETIMIDRKKLR